MKNYTYTKKFYIHEIAAVNLLKIYFLKNAKKTFKPVNRDLNRDWTISKKESKFYVINFTDPRMIFLLENFNITCNENAYSDIA